MNRRTTLRRLGLGLLGAPFLPGNLQAAAQQPPTPALPALDPVKITKVSVQRPSAG